MPLHLPLARQASPVVQADASSQVAPSMYEKLQDATVELHCPPTRHDPVGASQTIPSQGSPLQAPSLHPLAQAISSLG
jgi:hypothetical protein